MNTFESGRSMVEILAVLGLVGVLSIGGVAGYTTAMLKYKSNEILSGIRDRALAVSAYQGFGNHEATDLLEYKDQPLKGYAVSLYNYEVEGTDFAIQIGNLDQKMCEQIASQGLESAVLVRPNLCDAETDNIVIFGFKNDLSGQKNQRVGVNELSTTPETVSPSVSCTTEGEGSLRCNDIYMVEKCKQDLNGNLKWVQKEMCLYGCSGGICNSKKCSGNEQKCWGTGLLLTCSNGEWQRDVHCTWECENNRCGEDCGTSDDTDQICKIEQVSGTDYRHVYNCSLKDGRYVYQATGTKCEKKENTNCQECIDTWETAQNK